MDSVNAIRVTEGATMDSVGAATREPTNLIENTMQLLVDAIGSGDAYRLVAELGGARVTVPSIATPDHVVSTIIGVKQLQKLADEIGEPAILIPKCREAQWAAKDRIIREDYLALDARTLPKGTDRATAIGRRFGLCRRAVFLAIKRDQTRSKKCTNAPSLTDAYR